MTHGPRRSWEPPPLSPDTRRPLPLPPPQPVRVVRPTGAPWGWGGSGSEAGSQYQLCCRACWHVRWPGPPRSPPRPASVAPQGNSSDPCRVQIQGQTDREPLACAPKANLEGGLTPCRPGAPGRTAHGSQSPPPPPRPLPLSREQLGSSDWAPGLWVPSVAGPEAAERTKPPPLWDARSSREVSGWGDRALSPCPAGL